MSDTNYEGELHSPRKMQTSFLMFLVMAILFVWGVNKISSSMSVNVQSAPATVQNTSPVHDTIIQLSNDRIGIINGDPVYGAQMHTIMVFQYDSKPNKFNFIGSFDYYDYINNPSKYGIQTDVSN